MNVKSVLLIFIFILSIFPQSTTAIENEKTLSGSPSDFHLIENVPYIPQKELVYCELACFEMVLEYYGYNFTQPELLYLTGGGYSFGYKPTFKSIINHPRIAIADQVQIWTDELTSATDDLKLFAELFGLDFTYIYPEKIVSHKKAWQDYWERLKDYVCRDIPVITGVDPLALSTYMEHLPLPFSPPKIFAGTHIVVVVGFNEENNTICIHDPCAGYFGFPENGTYRWLDLDAFWNAVSRIKWPIKECRYQLLIFENNTGSLFEEEYIHDVIHKRNIQKSIGSKSSYDGNFVNEMFTYLGISALEEFRDDIRYKAARRMPFHKIMLKTNILYLLNDPVKLFKHRSEYETLNKRYISSYLYERNVLNPYYEKDSILLLKEAQCWENITTISENLMEIVNNNTIFKAMILSKPLFLEIVNQLDSIIAIRKLIIDETIP